MARSRFHLSAAVHGVVPIEDLGSADQGLSGDADAAETLLEWADERNVAIDNECWIGMCGCDVVRILEGAEFLNEVGDKELKTLKRKGLEAGWYRLACMARCSGPVIVEVAHAASGKEPGP